MGVQVSFSIWHSDNGIPKYIKNCQASSQFEAGNSTWLSSCQRHVRPIFEMKWRPRALGFTRRKKWQPTPVLLPGESHGRRSLVGYRLSGRKESDTTEQLQFQFLFWCLESACQCRGQGFDPWPRKIPQAAEQLSHAPQLLSPHAGTRESAPLKRSRMTHKQPKCPS